MQRILGPHTRYEIHVQRLTSCISRLASVSVARMKTILEAKKSCTVICMRALEEEAVGECMTACVLSEKLSRVGVPFHHDCALRGGYASGMQLAYLISWASPYYFRYDEWESLSGLGAHGAERVIEYIEQ